MRTRARLLEEGADGSDEIQPLLTDLYEMTGYDFRDYSLLTVRRRLQRRLVLEQVSTVGELRAGLHRSKALADTLIQDFSINVTQMFRDPHFFRFFREAVIPELRQHPFIRIWVAGCSTGEEAYSIAILLHEEGLYPRCRIYATDMNEAILKRAKIGYIPPFKLEDYAQNYRLSGGQGDFYQYLHFTDLSTRIKEYWLQKITFSHHNLSIDRCFNEFHVILCRNVLIYFNKRLQDRVHELLYGSLVNDGFLALGDKETIRFTKCASKYRMTRPKQKIFRRIY